MDQEERLASIVQLLRLRHNLAYGADDAGVAVSVLSQLRDLRRTLPELSFFDTLRSSGNGTPDRRELLGVIETALDRLATDRVSADSPPAHDRGFDYRVIERVASEAAAEAAAKAVRQNADASAMRSSSVLIGRWLLPAVLVIVLAGAYFTYSQVKGLVASAQQSQQQIENARVQTLNAASQGLLAIETAKTQALEQANAELQKEVKAQKAIIDRAGTQAVRQLEAARGDELRSVSRQARSANARFEASSQNIWTTRQKQELAAIDSREKSVARDLDGMPTYIRSLEQRVDELQSTDTDIQFVIAHRSDFEMPQTLVNSAAPGGDFARFVRLATLAIALALVTAGAALWYALQAVRRI